MHGLHARLRVKAYYAPITAYIHRKEASWHAISALLHALDPPISNRIVATAAPHREIPGPPPIFCHELITERALASRNMHRAQTNAHAPYNLSVDGHDLIRFTNRSAKGASRRLPPSCVPEYLLAQHLG